jgi:hypothetical protein
VLAHVLERLVEDGRAPEAAPAYREWREAFIARPLAELWRQAAALERPAGQGREETETRQRVEPQT